jgi:sterol desaturase/sphingolipid hydroxylase (fatty acid hydroxylase superfamily)
MLADNAQAILTIYVNALKPYVPLVLFILGFIAVACFLGLRTRVLSRNAIVNTATTMGVFFANIALAPFIYFFVVGMQGLYAKLGIPAISPDFWASVPWLVMAVVAVIAKDFCDYWSHRALHTPLLWPIHAVHHSDNHVNGFTTFRVHALEVVVMRAFEISMLSWIGIPPALVASAYIIATLHNAYVHFEVDIDHGPFNWLLASPRFHRWHHADQPDAYGKNLANMIPAWDMLFGTYLKAGTCHEKMGLERDGISSTDTVKLILLPFAMWAKQVRTALTGLFSRARRV